MIKLTDTKGHRLGIFPHDIICIDDHDGYSWVKLRDGTNLAVKENVDAIEQKIINEQLAYES